MHQNYFTAVYKLIKRLNACTFVSRSEKYRTRSERTFGSKRTERSERSLEPWCSVKFTRYKTWGCLDSNGIT